MANKIRDTNLLIVSSKFGRNIAESINNFLSGGAISTDFFDPFIDGYFDPTILLYMLNRFNYFVFIITKDDLDPPDHDLRAFFVNGFASLGYVIKSIPNRHSAIVLDIDFIESFGLTIDKEYNICWVDSSFILITSLSENNENLNDQISSFVDEFYYAFISRRIYRPKNPSFAGSPRVVPSPRKSSGLNERPSDKPVYLFISYSHKDERLRHNLEACLSNLQRQRFIGHWSDHQITPGQEWDHAIRENLEAADIILLLVSQDFLASPYAYEKEMERAVERHDRGEARVIPVILRPSDWHHTPFAKLQALPLGGKAVTQWRSRDAAWLTVAQGIRQAVHELRADRE